jgi:CrcB protein
VLSWVGVMLGGAAGAGLRYGLSLALPPHGAAGFPVSTLAANILGCLAIGLCATTLLPEGTVHPAVRLGVLVGVLGGFTTFSSFGLETIRMVTDGHWIAASIYVILSNGAGLFAVWLGSQIATGPFSPR